MEEEEKKKTSCERVLEESEKKLEELLEQGMNQSTVDYYYKVIDIVKDIKQIDYWKEKIMRYRSGYSGYNGGDGNESYSTYGRRMRDSRGRYMGGGSYGRRGVDSKYRDGGAYGHMDDMYEAYGNYQESMGNYGATQESMQDLEEVLSSTYKMLKNLSDNSQSQDEMQLIKEYTQKMSRL